MSLTVHLPEHDYIVLRNTNTLVKTTEREQFFNGRPTLSVRSELQPRSAIATKYVKETKYINKIKGYLISFTA